MPILEPARFAFAAEREARSRTADCVERKATKRRAWSALEARKNSFKRSREKQAANQTTTTTANARSLSPLFLPLSRPPSARIPFQMTTGQPRAHRRRPRRGAHRRHRPRCRLWYVNIDQEKKKNFSTRGRKPPTTKRFLLVFTLSPRFLCSPRSSCMPFQLSYKTRHRLRQVHLHAPHDGRLRRRPRAPGR